MTMAHMSPTVVFCEATIVTYVMNWNFHFPSPCTSLVYTKLITTSILELCNICRHIFCLVIHLILWIWKSTLWVGYINWLQTWPVTGLVPSCVPHLTPGRYCICTSHSLWSCILVLFGFQSLIIRMTLFEYFFMLHTLALFVSFFLQEHLVWIQCNWLSPPPVIYLV